MVKVKLYGSLKEALGRDEVDIEARTVEELLEALGVLSPKLRALLERGDFIILVNDRPIPTSQFSSPLRDCDAVDVMPVVSGGLGHRGGSSAGD